AVRRSYWADLTRRPPGYVLRRDNWPDVRPAPGVERAPRSTVCSPRVSAHWGSVVTHHRREPRAGSFGRDEPPVPVYERDDVAATKLGATLPTGRARRLLAAVG